MLSSPPPLEPAELLVNVLSITVTVPAGPVALPPLSAAKKLRAQFQRPPPLSTAGLPVKVLPGTLAAPPASLGQPPPSPRPPQPLSAGVPAQPPSPAAAPSPGLV